MQRFTFADRTAVVTGAASGIGRALAIDLARRGARVAISDVDEAGLAATAAACRAEGAAVHSATVDVRDRDAIGAWADDIEQSLGPIHLVINNAGVALAADVLEMSLDDLDWVVDIDLGGVLNGTMAFLPRLAASGDGHLVNISSVFGIVAVPTQAAYHAAKFGVRGWTEAIAVEMAARRLPVGVSCVHPGGIATNIHRNARMADTTDRDGALALFERVARMTPERAAEVILRGVERRRARIHVGLDAKAIHLLERVLGTGYQRIVIGLSRSVLRNVAPGQSSPFTAPTDPAAQELSA